MFLQYEVLWQDLLHMLATEIKSLVLESSDKAVAGFLCAGAFAHLQFCFPI